MSEQLILDFYKLPAFQKLSAYYMQSTVFNVLGVERSENRHSAFLAWLLNPKSSHGLNDSARTFLWMPAFSIYSKEAAASREALLRYCELDTWAMVKVWQKLKEVTE